MGFTLKPHTLILMIGPSGCGKTTFCKDSLIPVVSRIAGIRNVAYVSSDECREDVLNLTENMGISKYHPMMMAASAQAFQLLYTKIETFMKFPISRKFIIVDTKGTYEPFRNDMIKLAKENNYNICAFVFNYKKYDDFTKYWDEEKLPPKVKKSIVNDIKKMRLEIYKDLKKKNIPWYSIDSRNDTDISFLEQNLTIADYNSYTIDSDPEYLIISDIHGCWDELQELLLKDGITLDSEKKIESNKFDKHIILAGDLIDKGPKAKEVLEFVYANIESDKFHVVSGNHDHHLYKDIKNGECTQPEWYDTYNKLTEEERQKYVEVYEKYYKPFVRNHYMIVTHAPCHPKFLGKYDGFSKQMQSYMKLPWENVAEMKKIVNFAEWVDSKIDITSYNPGIIHYFGHVMVSTPGNVVNYRCAVDGGCAFGGKLIGISVCKDFKPHITPVRTKQPACPDIPHFPAFKRIITEDTYKPTGREFGRMKWMMRHKVNFISGTMTPCDKSDNALETVKSALVYYLQEGVKEVVMQPKYMGSRCNVYFNRLEPEKSYFVSRGGYLINDMKNAITGQPFDFKPIIDKLMDKSTYLFNDENGFWFSDIKMIIFDGELLPWAALGAGLINEFYQVYYSSKAENAYLKETGFEELRDEFLKTYEESGFSKDSANTPKKELVEKYGNAKYECYAALKAAPFVIPVEEKNEKLEVYKDQIDLYGSTDKPLDFRPFAILKIILKDGTEIVPHVDGLRGMDNHILFDKLNSDMEIQSKVVKLNVEPEELVEQYVSAQKWFDKLTYDLGYEGVVIKPLQFNQKVLPYMKVRNNKYLTIVYGYDYTNSQKYLKLYERKGIKSKLNLSKKEWILGLKMLKTPYDSINEENKEYFKLLTEFIVEEKGEQKLDPRL